MLGRSHPHSGDVLPELSSRLLSPWRLGFRGFVAHLQMLFGRVETVENRNATRDDPPGVARGAQAQWAGIVHALGGLIHPWNSSSCWPGSSWR